MLFKKVNELIFDKKHLDMSHPGFESLRDFVVHEIDLMTSECAQAFFKDEKEGTCEQSSGSRDYRVRQVAVDVEGGTQDTSSSESHLSTLHARPATSKAVRTLCGRRRASKEKPPPQCFVCSHPKCKHFLADCETFKALSPSAKRQRIFDAKRCLNCLALEHFARECPRTSKCRICGPIVKLNTLLRCTNAMTW